MLCLNQRASQLGVQGRLCFWTLISNMGLSEFLLLCIFYSYTMKASSVDDCSPFDAASCGYAYQPPIHFPFSVKYFGSCAYPGFNMSCNYMNQISIQIGSWGDFLVKDVDYLSQKVRFYDQHHCLPKRLLNLNLSGSPFRAPHSTNFTFYNCSSEFSSNVSKPISCLSKGNHMVFASSNSSTKELFSSCNIIASVMVPSLSSYRNDEIKNDVLLVWDTPDCRACLGQDYGVCGFKSKKSRELQCSSIPSFEPPKHGLSRAQKQSIAYGLGIPLLVFVILIICFMTGWRRVTYDVNNVHLIRRPPVASQAEIEQSTISTMVQSYPVTVLGESGRLSKPEDNICSICLSEYQPKEMLKTIPDCKHCFHATCIDEWLRKNVTCPICRKSPMPSPLAA